MPGVGIVDLSWVPPGGWPIFSAAHQAHHNRVASATSTPHIIIDPLNVKDDWARRVFLLDHYRAHNLINATLGTTGPDLSEVDFDDEQALKAWVDLNYTDHLVWSSQLGV